MSDVNVAAKLDLETCRCVACEAGHLVAREPIVEDAIQPRAIECRSCGETYDVIKGIPYLLIFEERDFVSLVEIAAALDAEGFDETAARPYDDSWPKMLEEAFVAPDRTAFKAGLQNEAMRLYFDDRFQQWTELKTLSGHLDLSGKNVLVLGAGIGFDANFILLRGARVTAVDLNPQMNIIGKLQTPAARWIGGLGRRLPFPDNAFDHVFINAALHHVMDTSATILEMLRVVKPGGAVVTTSDSYAYSALTDAEDAKAWNEHPAVLRGINENRHPFKVYIDPLLAHINDIDVEFWTSRAFGVWVEEKKARIDFMEPKCWDLVRDEEELRSSSGGEIFTRTTKLRHFSVPGAPPPGPAISRPVDLERFIGRKAEAMAYLAHLAPPQFVSPEFPGRAGNTKFQVLNGWRWREESEAGREAFHCGRWLMQRKTNQKRLRVSLQTPAGPGPDGGLLCMISVDGSVRASERVPPGTSTGFVVDVSNAPADCPIAVEVAMNPESDEFARGVFRVHELHFE